MEKVSGVDSLSGRQKEILRLIAQNMQAKEVARLLNISERTVKTHTEEARKRLGVGTSREAARLVTASDAQNTLGRDDRGLPRPMVGKGQTVSVANAAEGEGASGDGLEALPRRHAVPDQPLSVGAVSLHEHLRRLGTLHWLGLILLVALVSAVLMSGLLIAVLGTLEAIEHIVRRAA